MLIRAERENRGEEDGAHPRLFDQRADRGLKDDRDGGRGDVVRPVDMIRVVWLEYAAQDQDEWRDARQEKASREDHPLGFDFSLRFRLVFLLVGAQETEQGEPAPRRDRSQQEARFLKKTDEIQRQHLPGKVEKGNGKRRKEQLESRPDRVGRIVPEKPDQLRRVGFKNREPTGKVHPVEDKTRPHEPIRQEAFQRGRKRFQSGLFLVSTHGEDQQDRKPYQLCEREKLRDRQPDRHQRQRGGRPSAFRGLPLRRAGAERREEREQEQDILQVVLRVGNRDIRLGKERRGEENEDCDAVGGPPLAPETVQKPEEERSDCERQRAARQPPKGRVIPGQPIKKRVDPGGGRAVDRVIGKIRRGGQLFPDKQDHPIVPEKTDPSDKNPMNHGDRRCERAEPGERAGRVR